MNWQNVIAILIAAIIGFLLKILHGKIFEKKVNIYFELDKPTFFSVIPPTVCFQNIRIWNKGNLPTQGLKITLNNSVIEQNNVLYKTNSEETYDREINDTFLILKFAKLLPQEELSISFKSEKPLPQDFLINVKSDEMIAHNIVAEKKQNDWIGIISGVMIGAVLLLAGHGLYDLLSDKNTPMTPSLKSEDNAKQLPFSYNVMIDKNIYTTGQKIEIIYQIKNTSKETLKDLLFILEIPGIDLDYNTEYQVKKFIKACEQVTYKRSILIPNDFPHEKHKIILSISAKNLEQSFRQESFVYFEVQ
jgi:hypothetical protein